jgi:hypothetical protein
MFEEQWADAHPQRFRRRRSSVMNPMACRVRISKSALIARQRVDRDGLTGIPCRRRYESTFEIVTTPRPQTHAAGQLLHNIA